MSEQGLKLYVKHTGYLLKHKILPKIHTTASLHYHVLTEKCNAEKNAKIFCKSNSQ